MGLAKKIYAKYKNNNRKLSYRIFAGCAYDEIAPSFGLTKQRVEQIANRAVQKFYKAAEMLAPELLEYKAVSGLPDDHYITALLNMSARCGRMRQIYFHERIYYYLNVWGPASAAMINREFMIGDLDYVSEVMDAMVAAGILRYVDYDPQRRWDKRVMYEVEHAEACTLESSSL